MFHFTTHAKRKEMKQKLFLPGLQFETVDAVHDKVLFRHAIVECEEQTVLRELHRVVLILCRARGEQVGLVFLSGYWKGGGSVLKKMKQTK